MHLNLLHENLTIKKNIVNISWTDKMNLKRHLHQTKDPQNVSSQK